MTRDRHIVTDTEQTGKKRRLPRPAPVWPFGTACPFMSVKRPIRACAKHAPRLTRTGLFFYFHISSLLSLALFIISSLLVLFFLKLFCHSVTSFTAAGRPTTVRGRHGGNGHDDAEEVESEGTRRHPKATRCGHPRQPERPVGRWITNFGAKPSLNPCTVRLQCLQCLQSLLGPQAA